MNDNKTIYRLNDEIGFRKCSLCEGEALSHGDCTAFDVREKDWTKHYSCKQEGIHFHCPHHPEMELEMKEEQGMMTLRCPKCKKDIQGYERHQLIEACIRASNSQELKNAKLIRLDDWYVPEIKAEKKTSDYWIKASVKTDRDGDTIIVLYVGHKGKKEKAQFFIKPEKIQLTSDHKDLDPAGVLSEITVKLKGRTLSQQYD